MSSSREKAVQALLYGHGCANKLKLRLNKRKADEGSVSSDHQDLAKTILGCFSDALSVLIDSTTSSSVDQPFEISPTMSSPCPPPLIPNPRRDQRVSPKKRRTSNTEARGENWRDDSPAPIYYDGYLWRKYGQKKIKNSDHQRSYYRCAYNDDHPYCEARKHVQKIQEDPPVYRTTYFGRHACPIHQDAAFPVAFNPADDSEGARMIKFGNDVDRENICPGFQLLANRQDQILKEESTEEQLNGDQDQDQDRDVTENKSCPSDLVLESSLFLEDLDLLDAFEFCPFDQFDFPGCQS
ncbi:PREDICTED: probable WRKY transcription factor 38 [Tarenaya hassleriana]|uniref:probable WRKY transcription factor 38 n=1 Tax=Tarenaya hassleriana TaxID=28532 RepID=UPI00053C542D|nr:PREDICTED: probable WRKY transcription factor 38 [Tarenaya hassleriana]